MPPAGPAIPIRALIVTDDRDLRGRIADHFGENLCHAVGTSRMPAVARLQTDQLNLIVLDMQLEPLGGFDELRRLRAVSDIPVILMAHKPRDPYDSVIGLELGADDVLFAPLNPRELLARARAIMRRQGRPHGAAAQLKRGGYRFMGWELLRRTRTLKNPMGRLVKLSKSEYALLTAFLDAPRRPLSRVHLMRATRQHEDIFDRSIDVQVLRLRRKLQPLPAAPQLIRTERGVGYVFDADVEPLF
ncbi:winged helix-turn-helix domain-containing protein [Ancylobacter sp. VKM B-3255]|uniref:Winged helix-turn-helix domain-containing protein n=2 Tax=Ancylobacter radicis TaxID=2836179 RepID=A0ABS5R9W6_9HYPH|nr:winged helix-turn-helix domain-containing protein [Ancylobacter radicis]